MPVVTDIPLSIGDPPPGDYVRARSANVWARTIQADLAETCNKQRLTNFFASATARVLAVEPQNGFYDTDSDHEIWPTDESYDESDEDWFLLDYSHAIDHAVQHNILDLNDIAAIESIMHTGPEFDGRVLQDRKRCYWVYAEDIIWNQAPLPGTTFRTTESHTLRTLLENNHGV